MQGVKLYRHVAIHVEKKNVRRDRNTNKSSQSCQPRDEKQDAGKQLHPPGKCGVAAGSTHEGPEQSHWREIAVRLEQLVQIWLGELDLENLAGSKHDHCGSDGKSDIQPEPLVKSLVA